MVIKSTKRNFSSSDRGEIPSKDNHAHGSKSPPAKKKRDEDRHMKCDNPVDTRGALDTLEDGDAVNRRRKTLESNPHDLLLDRLHGANALATLKDIQMMVCKNKFKLTINFAYKVK